MIHGRRSQRPHAILTALGAAVSEGFPRLPGRDSLKAQCRDLTLAGSPLPESHVDVVPLTAEQVEGVGAPPAGAAVTSTRGRRGHARSVQDSASWVHSEPAPNRGRAARRQVPLVSLAGEGGPPSEEEVKRRSHSEPPQSDRGRGGSPAASINTDLSRGISPEDRRVAALERKLAQQDERIRQLFAQQLAEPHEDVAQSRQRRSHGAVFVAEHQRSKKARSGRDYPDALRDFPAIPL
jgi:hypothetical protein